jgi:hypothetical protein
MPNENNVQDFQIQDLYRKHDEVNKAVGKVSETVTIIKDNHLAHIAVDLTKTTNNVEWLLKYHWVIATASIGGLIAALINLMK